MKPRKRARIMLATGLVCMSASFIIGNFKLSDGMQGFLMGMGFVFTVFGFVVMMRGRKAKGATNTGNEK